MIKKNKKILVTGGSRGMGEAFAKIMVKKNFDVTIISRSFSDQNLKKKITHLKCNILKKHDFTKVKKKISKKYYDIVVHCIGGGIGIKSSLSDLKLWNKSLFFNVGASIELNNIIIPNMIKNNIGGKIIHISSYSTIDGGPDVKKFGGSTPYVCAKAFLNMYIKLLSKEFKKEKISFTGILPGPVLLKHKHWFKFKKENLKMFKKFQKEYMKNRKFLYPNQVGKFIFKVCNMSRFEINSKLLVIR
jgi:short-subunit dehydrogenase